MSYFVGEQSEVPEAQSTLEGAPSPGRTGPLMRRSESARISRSWAARHDRHQQARETEGNKLSPDGARDPAARIGSRRDRVRDGRRSDGPTGTGRPLIISSLDDPTHAGRSLSPGGGLAGGLLAAPRLVAQLEDEHAEVPESPAAEVLAATRPSSANHWGNPLAPHRARSCGYPAGTTIRRGGLPTGGVECRHRGPPTRAAQAADPLALTRALTP